MVQVQCQARARAIVRWQVHAHKQAHAEVRQWLVQARWKATR